MTILLVALRDTGGTPLVTIGPVFRLELKIIEEIYL